jgi:hypothetical protein
VSYSPNAEADQKIRRSHTGACVEKQAIADLHEGLYQDDLSLVILFASPKLASDSFAAEIGKRFAGTPVIGCTTAGEITPQGHRHGSIAGLSLAAPDFHAAAFGVADIHNFSVADGRDVVQSCLRELDRKAPGCSTDRIFAMLLIDGLDAREESVVSAIYRELGPIPLFGGSAGDDLSFSATKVLWDGAFRQHSAVLVMVATDHPFRVFKTEHFTSSIKKLVVTAADPERRIVTEINAEPAAEEYARIVGIKPERLTPMVFATYPVVVRVGNVPYVRSIQKVNPDGSLTFFCAIDEGVVLTVASSLDIEEDLIRLFDDLENEMRRPEIIIGYDCILRNLELRQKRLSNRISALMAEHNVIGFNTYGEQYQAMHVNQTFTGVAIGRR